MRVYVIVADYGELGRRVVRVYADKAAAQQAVERHRGAFHTESWRVEEHELIGETEEEHWRRVLEVVGDPTVLSPEELAEP